MRSARRRPGPSAGWLLMQLLGAAVLVALGMTAAAAGGLLTGALFGTVGVAWAARCVRRL